MNKKLIIPSAFLIAGVALTFGLERAFTFLKKQPTAKQFKTKKPSVALIHIEGSITNAGEYIPKFDQCADPLYQAVIVHINSGGGASGTGDLLYYEMKKLQKEKPVVVLVENMCCSAAYEIACGADWIVAPPGADIGSIGVRQTLEQIMAPEDGEKEYIVLYAGEYKVAGDPHVPLTKKHKDYLLNRLQKDYADFKNIVGSARNLDLTKSKEWAEGKIFKGSESVTNHLIDEIGGRETAYNKIKELLTKKDIDISHDIEVVEIQ